MAPIEIDDDEFRAIRARVKATTGIALNASKRALVVARLGRRLRHYGYATFREYCDHLDARDADGAEARELINCITTNKTDFFREPHHFEWLRNTILPELRARDARQTRAAPARTRRLRIWSAGCSTGQEPYSIAMILANELAGESWDARILASDIDTAALAEAQAGAYEHYAVGAVPPALLRKHFVQQGFHFVAGPALKNRITFRRINLVERTWPIRVRFDVIFCRNVTIYFDRETQTKLYERLALHLEPHGYLVAGHSENLQWLSRILTPVGNTVYQRAAPAMTALGRRSSRKLPQAPERGPRETLPDAKPTTTSQPPPGPREVAIRSGGFHAADEPTVIRTVLGSCVAACVFDAEARVGGMNHFMLPDGCDEDWVLTRFGTHAMQALVANVIALGGRRERLEAKIFGGARVLRGADDSSRIADQNIDFVRTFLRGHGIPIKAERVGGNAAMSLLFETHSGRAFVRLLEASDTVARVENDYRRAINDWAKESQRQLRAAEDHP